MPKRDEAWSKTGKAGPPPPRMVDGPPKYTPFDSRSLRDEIAMRAMFCLMTAEKWHFDLNPAALADDCYEIADAFVARRTQPPDSGKTG